MKGLLHQSYLDSQSLLQPHVLHLLLALTLSVLGNLPFLCSVILKRPVMDVSMPVPSNSLSP
jgi:hypothetical protein